MGWCNPIAPMEPCRELVGPNEMCDEQAALIVNGKPLCPYHLSALVS